MKSTFVILTLAAIAGLGSTSWFYREVLPEEISKVSESNEERTKLIFFNYYETLATAAKMRLFQLQEAINQAYPVEQTLHRNGTEEELYVDVLSEDGAFRECYDAHSSIWLQDQQQIFGDLMNKTIYEMHTFLIEPYRKKALNFGSRLLDKLKHHRVLLARCIEDYKKDIKSSPAQKCLRAVKYECDYVQRNSLKELDNHLKKLATDFKAASDAEGKRVYQEFADNLESRSKVARFKNIVLIAHCVDRIKEVGAARCQQEDLEVAQPIFEHFESELFDDENGQFTKIVHKKETTTVEHTVTKEKEANSTVIQGSS